MLFLAKWCAYSKIVQAFLDDNPHPDLVLIDIDEDLNTSRLHRVRSVPSLKTFDGTLVTSSEGIITYLKEHIC